MNNKQAVIAFCAIDVNDSTVCLELLNAGITELEPYDGSNQSSIALVACNVLNSMLALSGIKEGDLTINYDREGIKSRLLFLAKKYGFTDLLTQFGEPTISSPKVW